MKRYRMNGIEESERGPQPLECALRVVYGCYDWRVLPN